MAFATGLTAGPSVFAMSPFLALRMGGTCFSDCPFLNLCPCLALGASLSRHAFLSLRAFLAPHVSLSLHPYLCRRVFLAFCPCHRPYLGLYLRLRHLSLSPLSVCLSLLAALPTHYQQLWC